MLSPEVNFQPRALQKLTETPRSGIDGPPHIPTSALGNFLSKIHNVWAA